ncbi:hypothetical protein BU17DRAFT_103125 [Hysterangium stoloniferum]|nr:hypothetical protein BU17DRAFT_103125 [Hysterangium stoloniferum]
MSVLSKLETLRLKQQQLERQWCIQDEEVRELICQLKKLVEKQDGKWKVSEVGNAEDGGASSPKMSCASIVRSRRSIAGGKKQNGEQLVSYVCEKSEKVVTLVKRKEVEVEEPSEIAGPSKDPEVTSTVPQIPYFDYANNVELLQDNVNAMTQIGLELMKVQETLEQNNNIQEQGFKMLDQTF